MQPINRSELLYQKISRIIESGKLGLGHLDESLDAAVRMGAKIPAKSRALAIEATARIIDAKRLSPVHKAVLETIVLGNGLRPAFDIQQDSFDQLPSVWSDLNDARDQLIPVIRAVGRVNLSGHPRLSYAGTAFVCGANLLLTNRHVVDEFMQLGSPTVMVEFRPGRGAAVDLKAEVGSSESKLLEPTGDALFSTEWDVAIFKVKSLPAGVIPVPLAGTQPSDLRERTAAVIGYPAFDEGENLVEQINIFRGVFNKKRLQPGKFMGIDTVGSCGHNVAALVHDCSTLGGNSGSAVVDVASHSVLGVHFGSSPGAANYCVPSWELARMEAFASIRDEMSFT
jgi:endonuclease G